MADKKLNLPSAAITGDMREENMKKVCAACHNINFINSFYVQYEAELQLYNEKFAEPGAKLFEKATAVLKAVEGDRYAQFSHRIDWTWFELWHHEGRRARMGASMMAPDYTQWHGNYELARNFYGEYIPEIRDIIEMGKKDSKPEAQKLAGKLDGLLSEVLNSPDHQWSIGKVDPAVKTERMKREAEFGQRYR